MERSWRRARWSPVMCHPGLWSWVVPRGSWDSGPCQASRFLPECETSPCRVDAIAYFRSIRVPLAFKAAEMAIRLHPDSAVSAARPRYRHAVPGQSADLPPVRVGVIGYGYWGPNLVRNFAESPATEVVAVSDTSEQRLAMAQSRHPGIGFTTDCQEIFNDPDVDAVVIATPVSTHYPLGMQALQAGKHVLMSKPLADSSVKGQRLVDEARARNLVLMVDHTFVYTGAVRKIRQLVDEGNLGSLYYYDSVRINLGLFQHDVNVIWDLAVHDLSILDFLLGSEPAAVSATGMSHVPDRPEDMAFITVFFNSNLIAHLHVNWLSPVKVRKTLIGA